MTLLVALLSEIHGTKWLKIYGLYFTLANLVCLHMGDFVSHRLRYQWASYQYVKLRVAHTPGMPGMSSPPLTSNEAARKRSRHASRHVCHARALMHVGIANQRWWGNVFGIPGACVTPNFTYLGRGQLRCKLKLILSRVPGLSVFRPRAYAGYSGGMRKWVFWWSC